MGTSHHSLPIQFLMGTIASCSAVTISNPFEVVKTRLQLQGELKRQGVYVKSYRGLFHGFHVIFTNEGIRGVQKGLLLAYPYTTCMNGTRLGLYDTCKNILSSTLGLPKSHMAVAMMSGSICGAIGSVLANPFYVAKTRYQCQSDFLPVGYQHEYKNPWHALVAVGREEGFFGYFRGLQAATNRILVASAVQLSSYDKAKNIVVNNFGMKEGFPVFCIAACVSSVFLTLSLNPFDVLLTRLQNQKVVDGKGVYYKGWIDCFMKIAKTEGFNGFYKGTLPHYARLAPHTILLLGVFEKVKQVFDYYGIK